MRLLEMKCPGEFSLIHADSPDDYPYGILSHTWTDGQEVTYQDLVTGTGKSKTGYDKIKFCGKQASKDGLRYFWVDTCCIDKSDLDELTTTINSMFRWYRKAKKCYVYLPDVVTTGSDAHGEAQQTSWEAAFRESRWFTRGWTLQELIAPVIVEFFSKDGERLGSKASLEKLIQEITGIPTQALQGNPFSDFSIAERIEWSAQRQTAREEDLVYCLLGLCEVSMPPVYGEGKVLALKRLKMTVKGFSEDGDALKNVNAFPRPLRVLPFGRNKDFIGRQSQLNRLITILHTQQTGEDCTRVALVGLGGVGKTQIALECAFQLQKVSSTCSVFWVRATDTTSFDNTYREIGQQLEIPGLKDVQADIKGLVKTRLSQESAGKWLMIVDNADDLQLFYHNKGGENQSKVLSEYLPFSPIGAILFTTRDRKAATRFAGSNVVVVDEMDDTESGELLQRSLQDKQLIDETSSLAKLLALLTNLPLAIMQAGAYLNTNSCTISEYVRLYTESNNNVIELLSEDFEDSRRYPGTNPVATTWLISFEQIQLRDPLAADYMALISCIKEQDIPRDLLPSASELDKTKAIGTLKAFGFIKDHISGTSYNMHRLVHIAMQNWLKLKEEWRNWNQNALEQMSDVFPWPEHKNRDVWSTYLPHALYVITTIKKNFGATVDPLLKLLHYLARSLYLQGKFAEAEDVYRQLLQLTEIVLGKDDPDALGIMNDLAISLCWQGKYLEAEAMHRQVLQLMERVVGKDHPDTLASTINLAVSLRQQGKYAEAEEIDRKTLQLRERVFGKEDPETLGFISNLAVTLYWQGKYVEAEAMDRRTLQLREKVLGKEHPDTLESMNNIGSSLYKQGKYVEAEAMARQTIQLRETVLGKNHPTTLQSIDNLASSLYQQGKYAEAEAINQLKRNEYQDSGETVHRSTRGENREF